MLPINPKWLLEKAGITVDQETADLIADFTFRLQAAPNKGKFLKQCLIRAMQSGSPVDDNFGRAGISTRPGRRLRGKTIR